MAKRCRKGCECRTGGQPQNHSHRTAIARTKLSAPAAALHTQGALRGRVLDYGCGRGADVRILRNNGHNIEGYDPHFAPEEQQGKYDTILCTFVLNVIEDERERRLVLEHIAHLLAPMGRAYVTVRRDLDKTGRTSRGTWQGHIVLTAPAHVALHRAGAFITYELSRDELLQTSALAMNAA